MEEKTVLTLRLLLEEIKKDLPPFKIGLIFETMKSIYPSAAVKRNVGPTPNINDVVRKSMGMAKKYDDVPEPSTSIPKYTGPEVNVNDLIKSRLKRGGKVKRGNKKK